MKKRKKLFSFTAIIIMILLLTACGQGEEDNADIDPKVWDDSLKVYEITAEYVLNENFELTEEEEKILANYLQWSNEVLMGDNDEYSEADKELVNELATIIHSVNIHKDTQNYRALAALEDNFEKLEETFGK